MPRLDPSSLVEAVITALSESDASATLTSNVQGNPRHFVVQSGRKVWSLWVYMWRLTHGGGAARPRDEYRIQITSVPSPLRRNPNGVTLMVGYEPNTGCFAGFDLDKHSTFSTRSPSVQIPITALHQALQHGLAFVTKSNDEIAIGIRPDEFLTYCLHATLLHKEGARAEMVDLLTRAASLERINEDELEPLPLERQRIVREVSQLARDSSFRRKVICAYDRRCSVTSVTFAQPEAES